MVSCNLFQSNVTLTKRRGLSFLLSDRPALAFYEGFLSISCGASKNEMIGGFEWITDSLFIKFRNTSTLSPFSSNDIAYQYRYLAYFTDLEANKYCYLLPVTPHIQCLVRARFSFGELVNLSIASIFDFYIEGIYWAKVDLGNFTEYVNVYYKIILAPKSGCLSLCLARNSETEESRYVFNSTIELRPLQSQMYNTYTDFNYGALLRYSRTHFGSSEEIKFPDDQYDRMWEPLQVPFTTDMSTDDSSFGSMRNQPPVSVLKTAITPQVGEELLVSNWLTLARGFYYFALYLCNINKTSLSGNNTLQVFIGNVQIAVIDFPEYMYCWWTDHRRELSVSGLAIRKVADVLNVPDDWTTGDPCLPAVLPLTGVKCNDEDPPREFNKQGFTGIIPPSIANLTALTNSNLLGNNKFSGSIPDLSTLKNLTSLQLQNNQLVGDIPSWLEKLPLLNELFLQNNKLDGDVPPDLVKPGLNLQISPQSKTPRDKKNKVKGWIIGLVIGCLVLLFVVIFGIRLWSCQKRDGLPSFRISTGETRFLFLTAVSAAFDSKVNALNRFDNKDDPNEFRKLVVEYKEEDIKAATNNYSTIIGKGGFGSVFYGKLSGNDVSVKMLSTSSSQGKQEFRNEVTLLSRVHHKNSGLSIRIYGVWNIYGPFTRYCSAKQEKPLDWQTRINVALQAAQGLLYLHEGCSRPIIHRDVKCSNILLDKRMFAKITDFGLSKLLVNAKSYITTNVKGTLSYLDPEYFGKSSLNEKSDVYSFGVVLLEIICGVPPKERLVELAKELLSSGRLADLMDSSLGGRYSVESARKVANIAYACVEEKSINRSTMNTVVKELAEAKALLSVQNVLDDMPEAR
ncbi:putative leucine-rich repeat receptor-like serine/threonine-protein kinase At2g14440 [Cryptomeria japonica]|uniref:putative leucine-rich repeat receptor-like serine/threonine-protein kinase At2g14440 n=1 Tax=Cryptomeria japonica TaxID=3369 RepID=UPI0027DA5A73|nr:putative leucine-rich repeat receptor-like serine/threonine-protein kinase At2g14440 [Cryptomeria japonica]